MKGDSVLFSKAGEILLVVACGIMLLIAAIYALGGANLLKIPGTDLFSFMGNMFGFVESKIGLLGQGTANILCEKSITDANKLCGISDTHLKDYCAATDSDRLAICQNLESNDDRKAFCNQPQEDKERFCQDQDNFKRMCGQLGTFSKVPSMKDMPFCK